MSTRSVPWAAGSLAIRQMAGDTYALKHGSVIDDRGATAVEALVSQGLDFTVSKVPLYAAHITPDGVSTIKVDERHQGVQRSTDGKILGVVGKVYEPIQPLTHAEHVDGICEGGRASLTAANVTHDGRRMFFAVGLDRTIAIGNDANEELKPFLISSNSFDGSSQLMNGVYVLRMACLNGLHIEVPEYTRTWGVRHTATAEERMSEAKRALKLSWDYLDEFERITERLLDVRMTVDDVIDFTDRLLPIPNNATERSETIVTNKRLGIIDTWRGSPNLANIRSTGWGVLNAVTEWDQWKRGTFDNRVERHMADLAANKEPALANRATRLLLAR